MNIMKRLLKRGYRLVERRVLGVRFEKGISVHGSTYISKSATLELEQGGCITIAQYVDIFEGCVFRTYGGEIHVGPQCNIQPYCVIYGNGGVHLGQGVLVGPHVAIVANNHCIDDTSRFILEQPMSCKGIIIHDDVWIGAGAKILDGVEVGRGAVIAAGAVVTRSVPALTVIAGVPARFMRRRGQA